tara:strand:- start:683 stop:1627 length:945 start_codon:yes stop_codon:yes gene_type:complete
MKEINRYLLAACLFTICVQCTDGGKAIEEVMEEVERGAVLRNITYNNIVFDINDLQSTYSIVIEEQDVQEGGLLEDVDVYIQFIDRTTTTTDLTSQESLLIKIPKANFDTGPDGLLRTTFELSFEEALTATGLSQNQAACKDQFEVRLVLNLIDGRSFDTPTGSASILTDDCFFKSPYRYSIPIVDPIEDQLFTGTYLYTTIIEGVFGDTFGPSRVVEIVAGSSPNVRLAPFGAGTFEFTIACESIYPKLYESLNGLCEESAINILLGPDPDDAGLADPNDDSVFEIQFIEGYEGWSGSGNSGERKVRIRLSKQ